MSDDVDAQTVAEAQNGILLLKNALRGAEAADQILRAIAGADEHLRAVQSHVDALEERAAQLDEAYTTMRAPLEDRHAALTGEIHDLEAQLVVLRQVIEAEKAGAEDKVDAAVQARQEALSPLLQRCYDDEAAARERVRAAEADAVVRKGALDGEIQALEEHKHRVEADIEELKSRGWVPAGT